MNTATAAGSTGLPVLTGLSAFPLTPLHDHGDGGIDERAFRTLIGRLADARVQSITVLGSTGSYAYLDRDERRGRASGGAGLGKRSTACSST